ncbi:hypothetical protein ABV409_12655 [Flagellimonas sp. DF-77]|uniref:hypothetical protein n=1 Tax=Flagellimonas algarum TaxID=3230298 RepID=UPI003391FC2A
MRILTTVFLLVVVPMATVAQQKVSGRIVDELGLPVYRATIELDQTKEVTYSDFEGMFELVSAKNFHWKINIASSGYKPETYFVLEGGNAGDVILEYGDGLIEVLHETDATDRPKKPLPQVPKKQ